MDYLLEGARSALDTDLKADDVLGSYAGLRPLVAPPGGKSVEVKRNHEIRVDRDGMVTVVGGKLTTSRHMAEQTVDKVQRVLGRKGRCRTKNLKLLGAAGYDAEAVVASGGLAAHLGERYGTEARFITDLVAEDPSLGEPVVEGLPYLKAEVVYAVRHEMARTVDDVLSRRTRARLMARDASAEAAAEVGRLVQLELVLTDEQTTQQVEQYTKAVAHERRILMGE